MNLKQSLALFPLLGCISAQIVKPKWRRKYDICHVVSAPDGSIASFQDKRVTRWKKKQHMRRHPLDLLGRCATHCASICGGRSYSTAGGNCTCAEDPGPPPTPNPSPAKTTPDPTPPPTPDPTTPLSSRPTRRDEGKDCYNGSQCSSGICDRANGCSSTKLPDGSQCSGNKEDHDNCISGVCGVDTRTTYICCYGGKSRKGKSFADLMIEKHYCIDPEPTPQPAYSTPTPRPQAGSRLCTDDWDCATGFCAYATYNADANLICCEKANDLIVFVEDGWQKTSLGEPFCANLPNGEDCGSKNFNTGSATNILSDDLCASGTCVDGVCTDSNRDNYETCDNHDDCGGDNCMMSFIPGKPKACCASKDSRHVSRNDYLPSSPFTEGGLFCTDLPLGFPCGGSDKLCSSKVCVHEKCAREKLNLGDECFIDNDCKGLDICLDGVCKVSYAGN